MHAVDLKRNIRLLNDYYSCVRRNAHMRNEMAQTIHRKVQMLENAQQSLAVSQQTMLHLSDQHEALESKAQHWARMTRELEVGLRSRAGVTVPSSHVHARLSPANMEAGMIVAPVVSAAFDSSLQASLLRYLCANASSLCLEYAPLAYVCLIRTNSRYGPANMLYICENHTIHRRDGGDTPTICVSKATLHAAVRPFMADVYMYVPQSITPKVNDQLISNIPDYSSMGLVLRTYSRTLERAIHDSVDDSTITVSFASAVSAAAIGRAFKRRVKLSGV